MVVGTGGAAGESMGGEGGAPSGGMPGTGGVAGMETGGTGGSTVEGPPSCLLAPADCGTESQSCCNSPFVPDGPALLGEQGQEVRPVANVSQFYLDRFEVTVGRFRKFLASYTEWRESHPQQDEAEHPHIAGTGWQERWNIFLPSEAMALELAVTNCFGTPFPTLGEADNVPMNCVTWFEAFAFCIWDGGRLPTEIEWHYAATGGINEDRLYPWGSLPEPTPEHAVYACGVPCDIPPVGSRPLGVARWGQLDLTGSVSEWVFDGGAAYPEACSRDCANTTPEDERMFRGGNFTSSGSSLASAMRQGSSPDTRTFFLGLRCARSSL
jgi:formylglycine-generating enzyme